MTAGSTSLPTTCRDVNYTASEMRCAAKMSEMVLEFMRHATVNIKLKSVY